MTNQLEPKNHKKRRVLVLSGCLILFICAFFLINLSTPGIKASEITKITLTDVKGNITNITIHSEIIHYVEGINHAKPVKGEIIKAELSRYQLQLEDSRKELHEFTLWVNKSLKEKEMWIEDDKGLRKMDPEYFSVLLVNPAFNDLYAHRSPPGMELVLDDKPLPVLPDAYQWQIRKTDQAFYPIKTDYIKGNETYSLDVNQDAVLGFRFEEEPDKFKMDILNEGATIYHTDNWLPAALPLTRDGTYQGRVEMEWLKKDDRNFYGTASYTFEIQADYLPHFELSATEINPGELLVLKAGNIGKDEALTIKTNIDFKPNIFTSGDSSVVLLPVSYLMKEGKDYQITLAVGDITQEYKVRLKPKDFIIQYLTIDPGVAAATRNEDSAKQMKEKVYPLKPISDNEQYWEGAFLQPVEGGRVTEADFGKRRYVNNSPTSYRHNGLDIGQDEGTPIQASNGGRVLLAEYLIETGYTVIIEHGYGLKTWYYHMSELKTKAGDRVQKGDVIGLVGSTGFSTAPHLHFAASVNNVWVNPITLINEGVPFLSSDEE